MNRTDSGAQPGSGLRRSNEGSGCHDSPSLRIRPGMQKLSWHSARAASREASPSAGCWPIRIRRPTINDQLGETTPTDFTQPVQTILQPDRISSAIPLWSFPNPRRVTDSAVRRSRVLRWFGSPEARHTETEPRWAAQISGVQRFLPGAEREGRST